MDENLLKGGLGSVDYSSLPALKIFLKTGGSDLWYHWELKYAVRRGTYCSLC